MRRRAVARSRTRRSPVSSRLGDVQEAGELQAARAAAGPARGYRGLITDWGGVLTNPIAGTVRAWLDAEDIDYESYAAVVRPWIVSAYEPATGGPAGGGPAAGRPAAGGYDAAGVNPVHALERGECTAEEFEHLLASLLVRRDGTAVTASGLLTRMFAASVPCEPMFGVMYAARGAGLRTGLLSNSWGVSDYPRHLFGDLFDAVVISAEVGMRKPEERIFRHAAALIGLDPAACVFVDDIEANVAAAEAAGMTAVLHRAPEETVARLGELLGLPGAAP